MSVEKVVYKSVPEKDSHDDPQTYEAPKGFGVRHTQALILFLCLSVGYGIRSQLSISMVAMTSIKHRSNCSMENITMSNHDLHNITVACEKNNVEMSKWNTFRTYDWPESTREMIMFSFFVGYTTMMLPMGVLSQKFGGKIPILVALGSNGVFSIVTPWLPIYGGWIAVCAIRLFQGMTQAAFYPSIHTMLGQWSPISERGRLSTYIYSGSQCGTVIAFQVAGMLAGSPTFGWPFTFWLYGVACFVCFGLLWFFVSATPQDHYNIKSDELAFITGTSEGRFVAKKGKTPWKQILTCKAVWGMAVAQAGSSLAYLFLLTQIPLYMNKILHINIKENGLFSSLPYIAMYCMNLVFGFMADYLANKKILSRTNIRRVCNSIGTAVCAMFMLSFSFVHNTTLAVILLVCSLGAHSGVHVGFHINHIDLAPNFAGTLMSLCNMIGNLSSLTVPVLVTYIVGDDHDNQQKWQILFGIVTGLLFLTNLIYVLFAKTDVQPWNCQSNEEYGTFTKSGLRPSASGDTEKATIKSEPYFLTDTVKNRILISLNQRCTAARAILNAMRFLTEFFKK